MGFFIRYILPFMLAGLIYLISLMIPSILEFTQECFYGQDVEYSTNINNYKAGTTEITYSFYKLIEGEKVEISGFASFLLPILFYYGCIIIFIIVFRLQHNLGKAKEELENFKSPQREVPKTLKQIRKNKVDTALFKLDRFVTLAIIILFFLLGRMEVITL